MKFAVAWAQVIRENNALKIAVAFLALTTLALGVGLVRIALKPAVVVERACYSRVLPGASPDHTAQEIEAFLREAISQRFDSDKVPNPGILSPGELVARATEQKELVSRKLFQRMLLNSIKGNGQTIEIDADRLISVEMIRSAFPCPLIAEIGSVERSEANPYGLVLISIEPAKIKDKK